MLFSNLWHMFRTNQVRSPFRVFISVVSVIAGSVALAPRSVTPHSTPVRETSGPIDAVIGVPVDVNYSYGPPLTQVRSLSSENAAGSSTILVTYESGFSPGAQTAVANAVNIWSNVLSSAVPIRVFARFRVLANDILAFGGPQICAPDGGLFPGLANTFYAAALADRLASADVCARASDGAFDLTITINSTVDWDFGTTPTFGKYNLMTVVLHELCHGLGFIGSMDVQGNLGVWGEEPGRPEIFDRFAVTGSGVPLVSFMNGSFELAAQLVSGNTFFSGPNARANNGGSNPKLETSINPFVRDSSFSHVDDALYSLTANGLMTYRLNQSEVYTDPGPITRGILLDEGWGGTVVPPPQLVCTYSITPTSARVPLSGGSGSVSVNAPFGCSWTVQSNASFITVTNPGSGNGSGTVSYTVSPGSVSRTGTITIAGQTFTVSQLPALTASPTTLTFSAVSSNGAVVVSSPPQSITLAQAGAGTIGWTATSGQPWLTIAPSSGSGPQTVTVSVNPAVFLPSPATLTATITFAAPDAAASPSVTVVLNVLRPTDAAPPFGVLDTPSEGQSGITGSLAVTGWALDDFGVSRVRIFRDPVVGEPGLVFIGEGVFVKGARPDVAAAFPSAPSKDRAGWGYLLLTNFLPNQGDGTFRIHAFADDSEGHSTLIGSRTITCTNATAMTPFGTIDTPAQGETISGASYANFGWVLTPPPGVIPADESTLSVFIDGVSVGAPTNGGPLSARSDIQFWFAGRGYLNIDAHMALKLIDTTVLADGLHTIAWVVSDNLGRAAGIGSRFFTVANNSTSSGLRAAAAVIDARTSVVGSTSAVAPLRLSETAVLVTHGFEESAARAEVATADHEGVRHLRTAQLQRVAIDLGAAFAGEDVTYSGFTVDGAMLRELPVGSHLDAGTGRFSWVPGLAFGGEHDLLFVKATAETAERIRVRVTIAPAR